MPFKGTDLTAWKIAKELGRTKKERSKIYYQTKTKVNEKSIRQPSLLEEFNNNKSIYNNDLDIKNLKFQSKINSFLEIKKNKTIIKSKITPPKEFFTNEKKFIPFIPKQLILDDIRNYRSSKIISNVSDFIGTIYVQTTCKNLTNDQMNFIRSSIALLTSETINKALEEPRRIVENIIMFIKISKVVYRVLLYFNEKIQRYCVKNEETVRVPNDDYEYSIYFRKHSIVCNEYEQKNDLLNCLGKEVIVKVSPLCGSNIPNINNIFQSLNFGYITNIYTLDGYRQEAYIVGVYQPVNEYKGIVKGIISYKNDSLYRLIVCSRDYAPTKEEMFKEISTQEPYSEFEIII